MQYWVVVCGFHSISPKRLYTLQRNSQGILNKYLKTLSESFIEKYYKLIEISQVKVKKRSALDRSCTWRSNRRSPAR